jgi:recombination protein RecT
MNMVAREVPAERTLKPYESAIAKVEERFAATAEGVTYDREKIFAMQALMKTDFAMNTANSNPMSVQLAMLNVAATGLTLNPAYGYAYLVPRDKAIVLDISYKGLLRIATDTGSILWGRAEVVYERDSFTYNGPAAAPVHQANPFAKDRGEIIGAYCIAKTRDGDILTEVMDVTELEKIRSKSSAYTKSQSGPWIEWFAEMCRKSVIKRAQKTWPHSDRTDRLMNAIEVANEGEGGYTLDSQPAATISDDQAAKVREWIEAAQVDPVEFLRLFDVEAVEAIPRLRYTEVLATLKGKAGGNADH